MKSKRLFAGSILILLIFLLCYTFEDYYSDTSVLDISTDYSKNQIFLSDSIIESYDDGFLISADNGIFDEYRIKTTFNVDTEVHVFILGTLNSPDEINVIKIKTINENEIDFVIFRSLLGLILFLLLFIRYWKFKPEMKLFVRRK